MARVHDLGRWGERIAASFLEEIGGRVVDRNYRAGAREIDLVVRFGPTVAFVEVKTRSHTEDGLRAVSRRKQADVRAGGGAVDPGGTPRRRLRVPLRRRRGLPESEGFTLCAAPAARLGVLTCPRATHKRRKSFIYKGFWRPLG